MGYRKIGIENFIIFLGDHDNGLTEFVRIADGKADDQVTSPFSVDLQMQGGERHDNGLKVAVTPWPSMAVWGPIGGQFGFEYGRGRVLAKKALRLRTGRHRYFGKASGPGFILGWVYA